MNIDLEQFKKFLLDSKLVSVSDLKAMEKLSIERGQPLGEMLVSEGKLSEDGLRKVNSYLLGIPFISLQSQKIDKDTLHFIPEPIARKHNIVAYKKSEAGLEVAMLDPQDLEAIEFIRKGSGLRILPRLTDTESIKSALVQYQRSLKAEFGDIIKKETASIKKIDEGSMAEEMGEGELKKMAEDLPIVRIVDTLLSHAIVQRASDIHIEPYEKELVVRYRIDGLLHDAMILPPDVAAGITARIKVLANLRLDEKRLPQDGRFKIETTEQNVSFRVSILPTYYGEKIVMRLLPDSLKGFTLESSGFHGDALERIYEASRRSTGMILVTGPTGSGKSTTLYTVLGILNTPDVNISTIEDPIEYQIPRINQTQVKPDIGLTFASGLRSLVRQDPDIIMVGEIRDKETANLAINAALTGHLVLSTLHTNSAAGTVPRMLEMGSEPFLLVSTINVIVAQRLVRRLKNKEAYKLSAAEFESISKHVDMEKVLAVLKAENIVGPKDTWKTINFYHGKPGEDTENGFAGRLGIYEVLKMSSTIKEMIMKGSTAEEIEKQAKSEGMLSMIEDGVFKAVQGLTTLEEVLRVITE